MATPSMNDSRWETVPSDIDRSTSRLKVPNGWLDCVVDWCELDAMPRQHFVFVPSAAQASRGAI